MNPAAVVAAERERIKKLRAVQIWATCEYHGRVIHGSEYGQRTCLPCAMERLDSMNAALKSPPAPPYDTAEPEEGEPGYHCPSCGERYDSKCRTRVERVCFQCRHPEP